MKIKNIIEKEVELTEMEVQALKSFKDNDEIKYIESVASGILILFLFH